MKMKHKRGKHTLLFKSLGSEGKKEVSSVYQSCIYSLKNTGIAAIILWHIITISNNWFYVNILYTIIDCCCIFSIITPVFSVTWSSEIIIICCSRNISDYYQYWKILQSIFLETMIHSNCSGFFAEYKRNSFYLKYKYFVTYILSLWIHLMYPQWIKVSIS